MGVGRGEAMKHLKLENRYVLRCKLTSEAAIHLGTGVASAATDAPILRQNGRPFIPGSSLRGVIRSTVERIMNTLAEGRCCTLFETGVMSCNFANEVRRRELEGMSAAELDHEKARLSFCPICGLFGSTLMASRFKVSDGLLQEGTRETVVRDGVGIDRDSGTAKEKIKFDFEALDRGCDFEFAIELENADPHDLGLLYIALKEMEHGFDLGGKRSRGWVAWS